MARLEALTSDLVRGIAAVIPHAETDKDGGVRRCVQLLPEEHALTVCAYDGITYGLSRITLSSPSSGDLAPVLVSAKELSAVLGLFKFRSIDEDLLTVNVTLEEDQLIISEGGGLFEGKTVGVPAGSAGIDEFTDVPGLIGALLRADSPKRKLHPDPLIPAVVAQRFIRSAKAVGWGSYSLTRVAEATALMRSGDLFIGAGRLEHRTEEETADWDQATTTWDMALPYPQVVEVAS